MICYSVLKFLTNTLQYLTRYIGSWIRDTRHCIRNSGSLFGNGKKEFVIHTNVSHQKDTICHTIVDKTLRYDMCLISAAMMFDVDLT